jgi:cell division protein FtsA
MTSPRDNHEMIEATQIGAEPGAEPMKMTRAQLMMVIRQRIEELTGEVEGALKGLGFTGPVGRQVVLTGGGAELKGSADYAQGALGRTVRIGRPRLPGLPDAHSGPAFATLAGLAQFAAADELDLRVRFAPPDPGGERASAGLFRRLISAFRSGY